MSWEEWCRYLIAEIRALRSELLALRGEVEELRVSLAAQRERLRIWAVVATSLVALAAGLGALLRGVLT